MVTDEISRSGGKSLAHTMDMTDAADVEAMVRAARDAFGPVEVTSTEAFHQLTGRGTKLPAHYAGESKSPSHVQAAMKDEAAVAMDDVFRLG
jgi:NADP-dependent 3-hydroxy acid dehydrogenase YdfG